MPSFINHSRTYTWPPSFHLIDASLLPASKAQPEELDVLPDIDEDPFAHFISPVLEEDDPYDVLSLSAGIFPDDEPTAASQATKFRTTMAKKWARYVARHHEQLHDLYHTEVQPPEEGIPSIEEPEDAAEYMYTQERLHQAELREATRGRAQDLLTPERRRRGRRASRTLSGHRHSWREPSPELFTVCEEEEATLMETDDGESRRSQDMEVMPVFRARAKL